MKKVFLLLTIAIISQSMIAQSDSTVIVPQAVSTAFTARFPAGQLKKWEQRNEGYIAVFRQDGHKNFAYYSADGAWKGTETPIKWTKNLPEKVKAGWKNSGYYDWYVEDIKKIETPDQPMYALHVNNGVKLDSDHHDAYLEEYVLFFSESGQLVRKDKMQ
jgi:Putative beta-lactamase-inhibitor-like, PepSY-like